LPAAGIQSRFRFASDQVSIAGATRSNSVMFPPMASELEKDGRPLVGEVEVNLDAVRQSDRTLPGIGAWRRLSGVETPLTTQLSSN
jgi:hypothetical protein